MILVNRTVSAYFSPIPPKPGAITLTINGARIMPRMVTTVTIRTKKVKTALANKKASSLDLFCKYSVKTGIKDTENEPSAKSLLKRFGIRKATKNASATIPEPKKLAIRMSLTNPRILLTKVKIPTMPAALVTSSFSFIKILDRVLGLVYFSSGKRNAGLQRLGGKNVATHKSAIKRGRQSKAQRLRNTAYKTRAKKAIKEVRLAIANKRGEDARLSLNKAISIVQKVQSKGAIHKNTASRKISSLALQVNKLATMSPEGSKDEKQGPPKQDRPSSQT